MTVLINRLLAPVNKDAEWQSGQDQPHIPVNEGIDVALLLHLTLVGKGTSTPPGSPYEGEAHIIGASPSGAWSTFSEDNLAYYHNGSWREIAAVDNLTLTADDGSGNTVQWRYKSGTGWVDFGATVWISLADTPSSYASQSGKFPAVNSGETALEFKATPYDVPCVRDPDGTTAAEVLARFTLARDVDFPADFFGSVGSVETNPAATYEIDVQDDGTSIGTVSISTGGAFTFTTVNNTAKAVTAGSKLELLGPDPADGTIAGISLMFRGTTIDL